LSAHRELQLRAPPQSRRPVKDETMLHRPSFSRLLRAVKRRTGRVVARDTIPPLASSPDVTAADGTARPQAPAPHGTSTRSVHTVDIQWKSIDYGNEGPVKVPENWDQDTEAETTTDSPPVHRRISRVRQLVGSAVRRHFRPKSPLDTSSDHTLEAFDLPDPPRLFWRRHKEIAESSPRACTKVGQTKDCEYFEAAHGTAFQTVLSLR
jgi:hypothetical protein